MQVFLAPEKLRAEIVGITKKAQEAKSGMIVFLTAREVDAWKEVQVIELPDPKTD